MANTERILDPIVRAILKLKVLPPTATLQFQMIGKGLNKRERGGSLTGNLNINKQRGPNKGVGVFLQFCK